jgi:segregation and condensation protein A
MVLNIKELVKQGFFAGSLELVKEGNLSIKQDNLFDDIYVREIND